MITLDYGAAHSFVDSHSNAFWSGWDLVIWKKNSNGSNDRHGMLRNGAWGIAKRVVVDSDGKWRVPNKYGRG